MKNTNKRNPLTLGTYSGRNISMLCAMAFAFALLFGACSPEEEGVKPPVSSDVKLSVNEGSPGDLVTLTGNDFGNNPEHVAVYFGGESGEIINFSSTQLIVEIPENAITGQIILEAQGNSSVIEDIFNIIKNRIRPTYWIEVNGVNTQIVKGIADLSGNTSKSVIYVTSKFISTLTLEPISNTLYWAEQEFDFDTFQLTSNILSGDANDLNPASLSTVVANRENVTTLAVSLLRNKLYWGELSDSLGIGFINQASLSGNNVSALYSGSDIENPTSLKFDAIDNKLYFVDDKSEVQLALANGSSLSVLYDDSNFREIGGLAIDNVSGKLIVSDLGLPGRESDAILYARLDGSSASLNTLLTAPESPVVNTVALDVDRIGGFVYWLNSGVPGSDNGAIYRIKIDGTSGVQLIFEDIAVASDVDVRGRKSTFKVMPTFSF